MPRAVPTHEPSSRARRTCGGLLAGYVLVLGFVLLQPVPSVATGTVGSVADLLGAMGAPALLTVPERVEMLLNAAMFVPVTLLASLAWPRVHWANWVVWTFVASVLVELTQGLFLAARSAQFVDVVANTGGGLAGAALAWVVRRYVVPRWPTPRGERPDRI